MTKYRIACTALLVCLFGLLAWLFVLRVANPDMAEMRFFLTYWYVYALELINIGALVGLIIEWDKAERGQRD